MKAIENAAFISLGGASNVAGLSGYAHFKRTAFWTFLHKYHWRSIDHAVYSLRSPDRNDHVDSSQCFGRAAIDPIAHRT